MSGWLGVAVFGLACSGGGAPAPVDEAVEAPTEAVADKPPRVVPVPVVQETLPLQRDLLRLEEGLAALPSLPPSDAPDIVFIVLDTLRADRLGAYGSTAGLTPNLDAFAAEARVYREARATSSWTLPSHASMFTGLHPREHGAHGSPLEARAKAFKLAEGPTTLAERLGEKGYRRVGVAANLAFLDSAWGLARGFELWLCEQLHKGDVGPYVQGDRITALGRQVLYRDADAQPLFLFLNYMDAHAPWVPREGFTAHPERIEPEGLPGGRFWGGAQPGDWSTRRVEVLSGERPASEAELLSWREAYDAEVRWLDAQVGALLGELEALGVGPEDYVVITADHGEYLGEHGLLEHSKDVYEEGLRVPLMIRGPGFAAGVAVEPVSLAALPEILLSALGLPGLVAGGGLERGPGGGGVSEGGVGDGGVIEGGVTGGGLVVSELYWSRHRELAEPRLRGRFDRVRRSFVLGSRKLIWSSDGQHEAYDLGVDPQELRDVYGEAPWVPGLEAAAAAWVEGRGEAAGVAGWGREEALRGLGYLE